MVYRQIEHGQLQSDKLESKIPKKMFPIRGRGLECPGTHLLSAKIEFRFVFGKLKHLRIDWKEERKRERKKVSKRHF
jgi:hypothetical protein